MLYWDDEDDGAGDDDKNDADIPSLAMMIRWNSEKWYMIYFL